MAKSLRDDISELAFDNSNVINIAKMAPELTEAEAQFVKTLAVVNARIYAILSSHPEPEVPTTEWGISGDASRIYGDEVCLTMTGEFETQGDRLACAEDICAALNRGTHPEPEGVVVPRELLESMRNDLIEYLGAKAMRNQSDGMDELVQRIEQAEAILAQKADA